MQFQFEQPPEGESQPSFVTKPGFYHLVVLAQDPQPVGSNGQYIDGLEVTFGVCAGTHPDQFDRSFDCLLRKGNAQQKDGGAFCNRRLFKLFNATCLIGEHIPGQQTTLDTSLLVGRQLVAEFEEKQNSPQAKNPNGTHIELRYDHFWHVDDPAVKDVPKHAQLIATIPAELRRAPSSFKGDSNGPAAGSTAPTNPPEPKPKLSVAQMLGAPGAAGAPGAPVGASPAAAAQDVSDV